MAPRLMLRRNPSTMPLTPIRSLNEVPAELPLPLSLPTEVSLSEFPARQEEVRGSRDYGQADGCRPQAQGRGPEPRGRHRQAPGPPWSPTACGSSPRTSSTQSSSRACATRTTARERGHPHEGPNSPGQAVASHRTQGTIGAGGREIGRGSRGNRRLYATPRRVFVYAQGHPPIVYSRDHD